MKFVMGFSIIKTLKNIALPFILAVIMGVFSYLIKQFSVSIIWEIFGIISSAIFYFTLILLFGRKDINKARMFFKRKKVLNN